MKARNLINGAAYGPGALRVIGEAFEQAWSEIASHYDGDAKVIEQARIRLAHAILAVAADDVADPEPLKKMALQVMALNYRSAQVPGPRTSN